MGSCSPKTFTEFYSRFPDAIKARLRWKWGLKRQELEDWEHDVYVHLLSVPPNSAFAQRGCLDRIATYDPAKRGGDSDGLFLDYVHLIVDNFCRSQLRRKTKASSLFLLFTDLVSGQSGNEGFDIESELAKRSNEMQVLIDPIIAIQWKELYDRANRLHPSLGDAIKALILHSSQSKAAASLHLTEKRFYRLFRALNALARGEQISPLRSRRSRKNAAAVHA